MLTSQLATPSPPHSHGPNPPKLNAPRWSQIRCVLCIYKWRLPVIHIIVVLYLQHRGHGNEADGCLVSYRVAESLNCGCRQSCEICSCWTSRWNPNRPERKQTRMHQTHMWAGVKQADLKWSGGQEEHSREGRESIANREELWSYLLTDEISEWRCVCAHSVINWCHTDALASQDPL